MSKYSDNYSALIRPVPTIVDGKITWGWDITLKDKSDDKPYTFTATSGFESAEEALQDGGTTMLLWMRALDKVKELEVQEVNLDADLPAPKPEPEVTPEPLAVEPEKIEPEIAGDTAPGAPVVAEDTK